jgi:hypothetical protein
MKTRIPLLSLFASLGAASLLALTVSAQPEAPASTAPAAPARLPYGVEDVLKLSRAQVSDDVTVTYIHNSGTIYNLAPNDIVYLRSQGVSERVINTMLDQRTVVPAQAAAQAAAAALATPPAPVAPDANAATAAQYAPQYVQPASAPVYAEAQPVSAPASTLYVIPYSSGPYYYPSYGYYPYYGSSVVIGVGYGGYRGYPGHYYHGGYYHSGYHGGGHYAYHGHR